MLKQINMVNTCSMCSVVKCTDEMQPKIYATNVQAHSTMACIVLIWYFLTEDSFYSKDIEGHHSGNLFVISI